MHIKEMQGLHHRHSPLVAPCEITAILIPPEHRLYDYYREWHRCHHNHPFGVFPMKVVVLAWVNASQRKDGTSVDASQVASSVINQVNSDGSFTPVGALNSNGTTTTIPAPALAGTYQYAVQNIDINGVPGDNGNALAPVVIAPTIDSSPLVAPTNVTAVLGDDGT